jgi:hypothetical protein
MKIQINDHRKLFAVQKEFSQFFPNWRLEFLAKPNKIGNAPSGKVVKEPSKRLGDCRVLHNKGELTLTAGMTVGDLTEDLASTYGLSVRLLRKKADGWELALGNVQLREEDMEVSA